MTNQIIDFNYVQKHCDACGSDDFESLWNYEHIAKTKTKEFRFKLNNGICQNCGFVYVNPVPVQEQLLRYYSDCHAKFEGQTPTSDVQIRMDNWLRVAPQNGAMVEIGSNRLIGLHNRLGHHFSRIDAVEPNSDIDSVYSSIEELPTSTYDLVCHYYMLEHVSDVNAFLFQCRRVIKSGGYMICEVPNLRLFPLDPKELLWWEHLIHFSPESLAQVAHNSGFELVELGYGNCSIDVGFMAVFRAVEVSEESLVYNGKLQYIDAKSHFLDGVEIIKRFEQETLDLQNTLIEEAGNGRQIVFYGANDLLRRLLKPIQSKMSGKIIIIDDDEQKSDFMESFQVKTMEHHAQSLSYNDFYVFTSFRLNQVLRSNVERVLGKPLSLNNFRIYDYPKSNNQV